MISYYQNSNMPRYEIECPIEIMYSESWWNVLNDKSAHSILYVSNEPVKSLVLDKTFF